MTHKMGVLGEFQIRFQENYKGFLGFSLGFVSFFLLLGCFRSKLVKTLKFLCKFYFLFHEATIISLLGSFTQTNSLLMA